MYVTVTTMPYTRKKLRHVRSFPCTMCLLAFTSQTGPTASAILAVQAGLIICYAGSGRTASLVAKYRPNVPILTLVVPQLKSKGLAWELEGRSLARQFLIMRGVLSG